ncbi:MAG: hypothetical protein ACFE95_15940 [Candidatus Hodarchaeota archaeon]
MALVVCDLGGFIKISNGNINPYLFFDHQTLEEDNWENNQLLNTDFRQESQLKNKETASKEFSIKESNINAGIDEIISVAQNGDWQECHDTEPGAMWYEDSYTGFHDAAGNELPLPLCINESVVDQWYLDIRVSGGYEPYKYWPWWDYYGQVSIYQKGDYKGYLNIVGYSVTYHWQPNVMGVCEKTYRLYFDIDYEYYDEICIDSNQWPITFDPDWYVYDIYPWTETIPGKDCFDFHFWMYWSGCSKEDQSFVLILV